MIDTEVRETESFQDSVKALISLDESALRGLADSPPPFYGTGSEVEFMPYIESIGGEALRALLYLRIRIAHEGWAPAEVVDELETLVDEVPTSLSDEGVRDALTEALTISSSSEGSLHRERIARSIYPVLERVRMGVDFRSNYDDGFRGLVPVIAVRLEFDEPVNTSRAIQFQIPVATLDHLSKVLEDTRDQLEEASEALGSWLT